ncbi:hypothetical protein ACH4VX_04960 [Streptomyces sp. NPDC020731]|uniref:hypothetical protein n=1 Tax=Streptomyces sp. NPDC020731 TaxID=3365085 RepID=UPI0037BC8570
MEAALPAALAEGAGGGGGRRAVEELARAVGLDVCALARDITEAAQDPARREAPARPLECVRGPGAGPRAVITVCDERTANLRDP